MFKQSSILWKLFLMIMLLTSGRIAFGNDSLPVVPAQQRLLMDMMQSNPGERPTESAFSDPQFLKSFGYKGKVFFLFEAAQFGIDWKVLDPAIFPDTAASSRWVAAKAREIAKKYADAKAAGLKVYCMLDMLVLPKALVEKHKAELCNGKGKIDITKPFTQKCIRLLMQQMFDRFPQLDGLVIRTGETYLQDAPYYAGNSPLIHGMQDHVVLLNILRDEVCVKRNKKLIYRTWDFGQLHSLPQDYLEVTRQVAPHPNLYFSIKHTIVDFWRGAPHLASTDYSQYSNYWIDEASAAGVGFNPCLGIGQHKQIVEVQCQREYEGKNAHPDYIARGVIDGFEEYRKVHAQKPYSLNQFKSDPHFAGIWTWSRGGGWGGPYIKNEFWSELNAYVLAKWSQDPSRPEKEIFRSFAQKMQLPASEVNNFHELCLLSTAGVMAGQYSKLGDVNVVWTRDDYFGGMAQLQKTFDRIIQNERVAVYLQEKDSAVAIWKRIEKMAAGLHFKDPSLSHFVRVSCAYGALKYRIIRDGWYVMLLHEEAVKKHGDGSKANPIILRHYFEDYDRSWQAWGKLARDNTDCPTLYKDIDREGSMHNSMEALRKIYLP